MIQERLTTICVCVCTNHHLYPVIDTEKRETIFKYCSTVGGGIKAIKYNEEQDTKQEEQETVHASYSDTQVFALIGRVKQRASEDGCTHRVVAMNTGTCNALFYDDVHRGNIHNGRIRIATGCTITGFRIDHVFVKNTIITNRYK